MSKKPKDQSNAVKEHIEHYGEQDNPFIEERYEIINGIKYDLKPSPTVNHQILVVHLWQSLYSTCHNNGVILVAPIDVYLDEDNTFQPDLIYIANENERIIKEARIEGAPDLVAEVLSPSTSQNDKIHKKAQYEKFGVKEYWVADPVHFTIDQFILYDGRFQLRATYGDGDTLTSERFSCVAVDLDEIFNRIR